MKELRERAYFLTHLLTSVRSDLLKAIRKDGELGFLEKAPGQFVGKLDLQTNETILERLSRTFPGEQILSEESKSTTPDLRLPAWIIDPFDGSNNEKIGLFDAAIQMAFVADGEILASAIAPLRVQELFTAVKGDGAFKNGQPIRVSEQGNLKKISVFFAGGSNNAALLAAVAKIAPKIGRQRIGYPASICFSRVAQGTAEAVFSFSNALWDNAPGFLLIKEAGGILMDMDRWGEAVFDSKNILGTNDKLWRQLLVLTD